MTKKKQDTKNNGKEVDKLQQMTELVQRTQASFENYRKQTEKRVSEMQQFASKEIIIQLLPIIDNFSLALKNTENTDSNFVQGVELIYSQLNKLLEDNGIKTIETENKMFDPYVHEALMKVESDLPENTVIEELQKGFMLNDQVIRNAKVKISAGKSKSKEDN